MKRVSATTFWRHLLVAALGAGIAIASTLVFDLRVHVGLTTVTGMARYVCAAFGGALVAVVLDSGIREYWPI